MKSVRVYFGPPDRPMSKKEKGCWLWAGTLLAGFTALVLTVSVIKNANHVPHSRQPKTDNWNSSVLPKGGRPPSTLKVPVASPVEDEPTPKKKGAGGFPPP